MQTMRKQFIEWVEKYLQGDLTEEESRNLLRLIEQDPEADNEFRDNILIHYILNEKRLNYQKEVRKIVVQEIASTPLNDEKLWADLLAWERNALPLPKEEKAEIPKKISYSPQKEWAFSSVPKKQSVFPLIIFLSLLLLVIGTAEFRTYYSSKQAVENRESVQVKETIDAVWNSERLKRGQMLGRCKINLKSGLVKLIFNNGTELILRGPNEFNINNVKSTFCAHGELSAFVPAEGKGFEVITPFATFIDRGTEFSLAVSEQSAQLDVIKGNVDVSWVPHLPALNLFTGEGSHIDVERKAVKTTAQTNHFISKDLFDIRLNDYKEKKRKEESERDRLLNGQNALLARYCFDGSSEKVENRAKGPGRIESAARLNGTRSTEGFLPGMDAVALKNKNSSIRFSVPGEFKDLTLMALVRIDHLREFGNALFISDRFWEEEGSILWQILRNGRIQIQIKQSDARDESYFNSDPYFSRATNGTWCYLAVVADSKNRKISFYVDGKILSAVPWNKPLPLKIGDSTIGRIPKDITITERIMDGAIGEMNLFNRVLTDEEIRTWSEMK